MYYKAILYFSGKRNLCQYLIFWLPLAFKFSNPLQKGVPGKELCLSLCSKIILDLELLYREWVLMCISKCSKCIPDSRLEIEE